jgi:hypothetical protein
MLGSTLGMTGASFQASTSKGVSLGNGVEVGCRVGKTIVVDFVVGFTAGLGVREGAVRGIWRFATTAVDNSTVGEKTGNVGDLGFGVTSAVQAANKIQNTTFTRRFIPGSIAAKN